MQKFVRKTYTRTLMRHPFNQVVNHKMLEKIIKVTNNILGFAFSVSIYMGALILAFKWFLPTYGIEKTIVLLLISLISVQKIYLDLLKEKF